MERPSGSIIPSPSSEAVFLPSVRLASMTRSSEEDLWALAFSNVGRKDDHERSNNDDVAQASYTICGIGPGGSESEGVTGAW